MNSPLGVYTVNFVSTKLGEFHLSESDAKYYEGQVNAGRYLVTVDDAADSARDAFTRHPGYDRATAPAI